jgi:hypothetical protein
MFSPPDIRKNLEEKAKSLFSLFPETKEEMKGIVWDDSELPDEEVEEKQNG